jgi:hypothetical protein
VKQTSIVVHLQIKLSYSVHRDLNVKANNERGWDWTGSNLLQTPPAPALHNGYSSGPATPVNPLACTPEDAPTGRTLLQGLHGSQAQWCHFAMPDPDLWHARY